MNRREFLLASIAAPLFLPEVAYAFDPTRFIQTKDSGLEEKQNELLREDGGERFIWLTRKESGEQFKEVFFANGKYNFEAYKKFCWIMRDIAGGGEVKSIDANLLNVTYKIQNTLLSLDIRKPININSGYRSIRTNSNLEGAAKNSFHIKGKAIDISIDGLDSSLVGHLGVIMAKGGVGFYPMKNFIHIDTGNRRQWTVDSKNNLKMLDL
ncbi:MAG TPA: DUF882 domain-containing protein [Campylobacterales bacterium]|nr:DUF882 domain-containing protein [Campylobacterales bacterium]